MSFSSSTKNPYESKLGGQTQIRGGSSGKGMRQKREEATKMAYTGSSYERPQSAKNQALGLHQMAGKEDLIITNGNSLIQGFHKKRYPTSNPRDGLIKRK